jgi:TPR repeat protein
LLSIAGVKRALLATVLILAVASFARTQEEHRTITIGRNSYAAIAYSPSTGKYAYSYDLRSRAAAEKAALEKCNVPDARVVCWVNRGWAALALGDDKSCWGVGWEYGGGANNLIARQRAIDNCKNRTTGVHCSVVLSSDGQSIDDYKDHITITDRNGNVYDGNGNPITPTPKPAATASGLDRLPTDKKVTEQYNLGVRYETGDGVSKDLGKAAELFQKAADQGFADAQYDLGVLYEMGQGVPKDFGKAAELYKKAADQGNQRAIVNLKRLSGDRN